MRRLFFVCTCLVNILASIHTLTLGSIWLPEEKESINISNLTNNIHRRYYYIARLEQTIKMLYRLHVKHSLCLPDSVITRITQMDTFTHPHIQQCTQQLIEQYTLHPLFTCWEKLITYKSLENNLLEQEFSILLYILVQELISHTKIPNKKILKSLVPDINKEKDINTHTVSFRFYLLKRINQARILLKHYKQFLCSVDHDELIFTHPRIHNCYAAIKESQSTQPIEKLCHEIEQFRFIHDSTFVYEFLQLLFVTHSCTSHQLQKNKLFTKNSHSYGNLSDLSLKELFKAIDIETEKIASIIKKKSHNQNQQPLCKFLCLAAILTVGIYVGMQIIK